MAVKLQKKSKQPERRPLSRQPKVLMNNKQLVLADAKKHYDELVQTAVERGIECVDMYELHAVSFPLKKSIDDFHAEVTRLELRNEAKERLIAAHQMQPDMQMLRERIREATGKLETLRNEFYTKETPLVQEITHAQDELRSMADEENCERGEAMRILRETADPAILNKIEALRKQQTKVRDRLDTIPRELARAKHEAKTVEKVKKQFEDWKAKPTSRPTGR
jgi:hypothetical protein